MTCDELQRLVQGLSTSCCLVSNFEICPFGPPDFPPTLFSQPALLQRSTHRTEVQVGTHACPSPLESRGRRDSGRDLDERAGPKVCARKLWVFHGERHGKVAEPADKPGSVLDSHSSRRIVADTLEQPTRTRRGPRHEVPIWPCSRWGLPCRPVARLAVRSYRTISPLPVPGIPKNARPSAVSFCCTFRRLAPPRRYLAPCPVEPGLSSASALRTGKMTRLPGRLRHGHCRTQASPALLLLSAQPHPPRHRRLQSLPYSALRGAPLRSAAIFAAVDGGRCWPRAA